ncbi:MAG: hypothetical protein RR543_05645 [Erysipelotrichales bacterium]
MISANLNKVVSTLYSYVVGLFFSIEIHQFLGVNFLIPVYIIATYIIAKYIQDLDYIIEHA